MPYFLKGKCVWKGTKESPIEEVKCHPTRDKALAHLAALYVHVEDVQKDALVRSNVGNILNSKIHGSFTITADMLYGLGYLDRDERIRLSGAIGDSLGVLEKTVADMDLDSREVSSEHALMIAPLGLYGYKEYNTKGGISDRWIAVSTVEMVDRQGEIFTTDAMDFDIARVQRLKEYPELRLYHVRGFKLGMCDYMSRVDRYAVDQGYWNNTPFAQAMKDLVAVNDGKWRVSRGFHPVKAAGQCHKCGADLTVGSWNFILGARCGACSAFYAKPRMLKDLRHTQAVTFDISITDVPAVTATAVTAYTLQELDQTIGDV